MTYPITADQAYYTVVKDCGRTAVLSGPFESHGKAADDLDRVRYRTREDFPTQVAFAAYGVILVRAVAVRRILY
jgi:hypothetical protein